MKTRSGRSAQAVAQGRSAPSTGTQATTQRLRVPKGRGAVPVANATPGRGQRAAEVAAVVAIPGNSDVDLATAQPHQVVLYESEEEVLGAPQSAILSFYIIIWHSLHSALPGTRV